MMVGCNRNRWLPHQVDLLERLIDGGTSYEDAVQLVGHPILSCRSKMSEIRNRRHAAERQKPGELAATRASLPVRALIAKRPLAPMLPTAIADPPHGRSTSTAKLVAYAELRSRIAVLGVTSGLLGDPMPGRSALDRMRAGMVDPPPLLDRRFAHYRPKVTLATETANE